MAACLVTGGDKIKFTVLHPFERGYLESAFRWIAFVIGGVDGKN